MDINTVENLTLSILAQMYIDMNMEAKIKIKDTKYSPERVDPAVSISAVDSPQ
jgi:hypothetical protein